MDDDVVGGIMSSSLRKRKIRIKPHKFVVGTRRGLEIKTFNQPRFRMKIRCMYRKELRVA